VHVRVTPKVARGPLTRFAIPEGVHDGDRAARSAPLLVECKHRQSYREGGFKAKLAKMTDGQALDALAKDGKLIKRPLVVGDGFALVGFHEAEWARAIRKRCASLGDTCRRDRGRCTSDESFVDAGDGGIVTTVLASGLLRPFLLAVDSNNVYWTNYDGGTVMQCATGGCGGTPKVLASSQGTPQGIAVDASYVYWAANGTGTVRRCPIGGGDGGPPTTIASSLIAPVDVAVGGGNVYFTDQSADKVLVCPASGCTGSPKVLASSQSGAYGIRVDTNDVYWLNGVSSTLMELPLPSDGGAPKTLMSGTGNAGLLNIDSQNLFWASYSGGIVVKCSITNCSNTLKAYALNLAGPVDIVSDGTDVYWTNGGTSGSVMTCPVAGCNGTPTTLASSLSNPIGIAVDATSVYVALATEVIKLTPK
jgi:hypothetical protein